MTRGLMIKQLTTLAHSTRPVFWAGLVGVPLLCVTAYAYYIWYHVLMARGYGQMFDAGKYYGELRRAGFFLLIALLIGIPTYGLTKRFLNKSWRIGYVMVLSLGIALVAVHWLIEQFGPTPWWHHP